MDNHTDFGVARRLEDIRLNQNASDAALQRDKEINAHAGPGRARRRSLISERNLASRRIRFQEKRLFNQHCDKRGYGVN